MWGLGWERSDPIRAAGHCVHAEPAHGPAAAAIHRGSALALNVLHADNVPAHNMRTFEIPPCGAVMLSEATAEIASFFEPDRACLLAADPVALRAHAERALDDPAQARAIAREGARAAAPHTYQARVRTILGDLGVAAGLPRRAGARS